MLLAISNPYIPSQLFPTPKLTLNPFSHPISPFEEEAKAFTSNIRILKERFPTRN